MGSFLWAIDEAKLGKKIRRTKWTDAPGQYIHIPAGCKVFRYQNNSDVKFSPEMIEAKDWELWQPATPQTLSDHVHTYRFRGDTADLDNPIEEFKDGSKVGNYGEISLGGVASEYHIKMCVKKIKKEIDAIHTLFGDSPIGLAVKNIIDKNMGYKLI